MLAVMVTVWRSVSGTAVFWRNLKLPILEKGSPNEKGEKKVVAEGETDRKGGFVIPLQHKNLKSGNYTVTLEKSGFRTVTKTVKLKDGPNELGRIALELIGRFHHFNLEVGSIFFDGALPLDPSVAVRGRYVPPISWLEEIFTLNPYFSFWVIPDVNIGSHRPFNFQNFQAKIDSGTIWGWNVGLMHASNLAKWGISPRSADVFGDLYFGLGFVRYLFETRRLAQQQQNATNARNFDSTDSAFGLEYGVGLRVVWPNGFDLGVRGLAAPTKTDIFNGGSKWRWAGKLFLMISYSWGG